MTATILSFAPRRRPTLPPAASAPMHAHDHALLERIAPGPERDLCARILGHVADIEGRRTARGLDATAGVVVVPLPVRPAPPMPRKSIHRQRLARMEPGREQEEFRLLALELERIAAAKGGGT